jgi:hypothetical protein
VRGETGNGAKFGLERGANTACVASAAEDQTYRFRPPFLWFISFGGAKEMNKNSFNKVKKRYVIRLTKPENRKKRQE